MESLQFFHFFAAFILFLYSITLKSKDWYKFIFPLCLCNYAYVLRSYEYQLRWSIEMDMFIASAQKMQLFFKRFFFFPFLFHWQFPGTETMRFTCSWIESDPWQASDGLPLTGSKCTLESKMQRWCTQVKQKEVHVISVSWRLWAWP